MGEGMVPREIPFKDYRLQMVRTMPEKLYCGDKKTTWIQCELAVEDDKEHTFKYVTHSCHRPVCNICGDSVIKSRTFDVYRRLEATRTEYLDYGVDLGEYVELILSPPPEDYHKIGTIEGLRHQNRSANEFARKIGWAGGFSVLHPVRGDEALIDSYMHGETELDLSPHYHYIGWMPNRYLIKSDEFYEKTGWVYKTVLRRKWGKSLWAKINYELDHAGVVVLDVIRDNHGVEEAGEHHLPVNRWHGISSYNNLEHKELEEEEHCQCGHPLQLVREGLVMADRVNKIVHEYTLDEKAFARAVTRYNLRVVPVTLAGLPDSVGCQPDVIAGLPLAGQQRLLKLIFN